ncbi:cell envelope integrity protein CreD [Empedobacter falsenii]|uniref:cell envelope integrity protein CreD n=1 Tax=Empedobacter falsenii TaxID=343874 RepID=UPI002575F995|nr:cell envelope integrity protein CreD [Empedobacter falsenii]MDM1296994.1 cell envelope integrity protein CreD [Empedobacter falsenii]MDM1316787.1 cell envelope integrity protein CreD [Empedobacter falsenii]
MENNDSENEYQAENQSVYSQNKTMIKGFLVCLLVLGLLIPIPFILNLIEERQGNKEKVITEISDKWSGKQTIYGPFIEVTYMENVNDGQGKVVKQQMKKYVSANDLNINGTIDTQLKSRSIYEAVVYNSKLNINSKFKNYSDMLAEMEVSPENVVSTKIVFGISDSKGYENKVVVQSNNKNYPLNMDNSSTTIDIQPEVRAENGEYSEQTTTTKKVMPVQMMSQKIDPSTFDFNQVSIDLVMKGSQMLNIIPSAINTKVDFTTNWKDLKYDGNFLPNSDPETKNGKTNVKWSIYQQNPLQGQIWQDASNFSDYSFGVNFLQMNDHYDKTYRSTKYAILFIGLTFVAFFFIESRNNFNIHLVQYALVGFAICVNFVLLLSFSEYLGFDIAYFISSGATILLITFFVNSFLKSFGLTFKITLMLILLYAFIYSVLQLKEHALLVGSIGLFIIVAILMYYSKNIEWNKTK